ncbi:MAG: hypothetical protein JNJ88_20600 [Planctomycetes bacterium]|nr:hypothetical protein [Planctomycetota bacterium]
MKPSSAGFALAQFAWLAALALLLHEYRLEGTAAAAATAVLGALALLLCPWTPFLAWMSPEPINGAKWVAFSSGSTLALMAWLARWPSAPDHVLIRWVLCGSMILNALALVLRREGRTIRDKSVQWRAGGTLMLAVGAVGAVAAAAITIPLRLSIGSAIHTSAGILLTVIFTFFLATRFAASRRTVAAALVLTLGSAAALVVPGSPWLVSAPGEIGFGRDAAGGSQFLGTLYACTHIARAEGEESRGVGAWTTLAAIFTIGASCISPWLAAALIPAGAVAALAGWRRRAPAAVAAGTLLLLLQLVGAVLSWSLLSRSARESSFALRDGIPGASFLTPPIGLLVLHASLLLLAAVAWRRVAFRFEAASVVLSSAAIFLFQWWELPAGLSLGGLAACGALAASLLVPR